MELYYKTLGLAKISTLTEQESSTKQYSQKGFEEWVKSVDIYNLDDQAINFPAAGTLVPGFRKFRENVGRLLSQKFKYKAVDLPGELKDIGSCVDGSKVGKMNEVDNLYVMDDRHFIIKPTEEAGIYKVAIQVGTNDVCEVKPRQLREQLADHYDQLVSQMKLPDCLNHGGYNSLKWPGERSAYSGLRYNGPASTSQFLTDGKSLLTWDVTPCIEFADSKIETEVRNTIRPIEIQNPKKQFPSISVHLIPYPLEDLWVVSTAHFEAKLLSYLSDEAPVKKALMLCKILCSLMKRRNQMHNEHTTSTSQGFAGAEQLIRHLESNKQNKDLEKNMRFAHIWLSSDSRAQYKEDQKSNISVNTAAVKHIIIGAALKMPEKEEAFGPKPNIDLVLKLTRVVFETLGNDQNLASDHAFLSGTKISHFSLLPNNASNKVNLARSVCEQCRILLSGAMTEVGIN